MELNQRRAWWAGAAGVALIAIAAHARDIGQPLGGDDVYVLEGLRSATWWHRLFAFDLDTPGADHHPWWFGEVVQRRFIRVPASALLWLETRVFGASPVAYSCVTLALVVASCLLIYAGASRRFPGWKAALMALVPAVHPATSEIVAIMNRQPVATAGLFSVAAAVCWARMRERFSTVACVGALASCALAVTAYEAAIALPFALVVGDLWGDLCMARGSGGWDSGRDAGATGHSGATGDAGATGRSGRRLWGPRLGALFIVALYLPFEAAIRHGLVAPDTTSVRPMAETALALRYDLTAYVLKAVGLFNPLAPTSYWLQRTAGEPLAIALAIAILLGLAARFGGRRVGWLGLAVFALFLAPPLLTRATVSIWNFPTLRQLYLPILLAGPLMMAAWLSGERRLWGVAAGAWLTAMAAMCVLGAGRFGVAANIARGTASLLEGVPATDTVVGIGEDTCGFSPSLIREGPVVFAIPAGPEDADPELLALGPRDLLARAETGFDILEAERPPTREAGPGPGPAWLTRIPPPLVSQGWQRIDGASVTVAKREGDRITALRYDFDRPLAELVFIRFHGCDSPSRAVVRDGGAR